MRDYRRIINYYIEISFLFDFSANSFLFYFW